VVYIPFVFCIALEKVIRDADINTRRTIFFKSVQIFAYADDDIIARTETAMKEAFTNLEKAAKKMHLNVNQEKTKYMPVTRKDCTSYPSYIEIESYKFEIVHSFTYLGSEINCKNNVSIEVRKRILSAGRTFHGQRKTLRSQLLSRKKKLLIYKTLVRPVIMYASETWT
jgi:sorting nexin-29